MARHNRPGHALALSAAKRFIEAALEKRDSIFTPGTSVWTDEALADFNRRTIDQPQQGKASFLEKFKTQLKGAPRPVIQLAAELLYTHLIAGALTRGDKKRQDVKLVLSWSREPIRPIDEAALADLDGKLVGDQGLNMRHPECVWYLARFVTAWWQQHKAARTKMLADPWAFKEFAYSIDATAAQPQREILLYMVHPDTFEVMSSLSYKKKIADFFEPAHQNEDLDRRLLRIRERLTPQYGEGFDYWVEPVRSVWMSGEGGLEPWQDLLNLTGWDALVGWAKWCLESADFGPSERDYKLRIAERMKSARQATLAGHKIWLDLLKSALTKENNLLDFRVRDDLLTWMRDESKEALAALRALWNDGATVEDRGASFLALVPEKVLANKGRRVQVLSVLLMANGAEDHPPVKVRAFRQAYDLVGHLRAPRDPLQCYLHAVGFLDEFVRRAQEAGVPFRDRLDAQSALWMIVHWSSRPSDWTDEQWKAFVAFRDSDPLAPSPDDEEPEARRPERRPRLEDLAARLLLPTDFLENVRALLEDKGQIIFYGPPGTGKTYLALELAQALAAEEDDVVLVQFHPSYAYEDFFEGYRPKPEGEEGFHLVPGPLKRLAQAASDDKGLHVLVIDEINRGNLPRVFGELFFLLEYRDRKVSLQYSPGVEFALPKNLWVIGTMNTADRSIALIDAALRRRFHFIPLFPDQEPLKGLLSRWFARRPGLEPLSWIADVLDLANEQLRHRPDIGRHLQIGPSHFMKESLTEADIERIWAYSITPYLEEQFFGREDVLKEFDLDLLRERVQKKAEDGGA